MQLRLNQELLLVGPVSLTLNPHSVEEHVNTLCVFNLERRKEKETKDTFLLFLSTDLIYIAKVKSKFCSSSDYLLPSTMLVVLQECPE